MQGLFSFQRSGPGKILNVLTSGVSAATTLAITPGSMVEIANVSNNVAAAFVFTPASGTSATAATTALRTIPPLTVMQEFLPAGASYVAAAGSPAGYATLVFTPGVPNG